jgi:hypothetical protein
VRIDTNELKKAVEELLLAAEIYDVDGFGWLNADDIDPEFAGYAMWSMNPPYEFAFADEEPARMPTANEERLLGLGTDFLALMKASRYAIGSVLLHRSDIGPWDFESTPFDFYDIHALVSLGMASDRLRDLLVAAFLKESPRHGHELDQFRLALCTARLSGLHRDVDALESLTPRVKVLKESRNVTVHQIALREAKVQRQLIIQDRAHSKRRQKSRRGRSSGDTRPVSTPSTVNETEHLRHVGERISQLKESYNMLIKCGDLAFRLEYDARRRSREARS